MKVSAKKILNQFIHVIAERENNKNTCVAQFLKRGHCCTVVCPQQPDQLACNKVLPSKADQTACTKRSTQLLSSSSRLEMATPEPSPVAKREATTSELPWKASKVAFAPVPPLVAEREAATPESLQAG